MMHKSYDVGTAINSAVGDGAKVENHQHIYGDKALTFPISNVTQGNLCFVGREAQLVALAANEAGPLAITQAVAGLGGVGKSQLLRQFAHLHRDQYDIIWWVRVDEAWAEDMIALGRRLQLPVNGIEQAAAVEMVRSWLCGSAQSWLLLADNADLTPPGELYPHLPSNPKGRVLISSRNPNWGTMARVVTLGVFAPAESAAFWAARLGAGTEPEQAARARLAEELGDLPLALEHAAAYMEAIGEGAKEYYEIYISHRQELWQELTEAPVDYPATVATTWLINFTEVQKTAGAAELLAVCAFLAPDDLPLPSLWEALDEMAEEDVPEGLRPLWKKKLARIKTEQEVRRYSLLTREEAGGLGIHRLVQTVYRDQMGETEAQAWVKMVVPLLYQTYSFDPHDTTTWIIAARLQPHLEALVISANNLDVFTNETGIMNRLIGAYHHYFGNLGKAKSHTITAINICEQTFGSNHPQTGLCLDNMGSILMSIGERQDLHTYFEKAYAIFERTLGLDNAITLKTLENLASSAGIRGDLITAKANYEKALTIRKKTLGLTDHPDVANNHINLGNLFLATDDIENAEYHFKESLNIYKTCLGTNHPETAYSLYHLGRLYFMQSRIYKAERTLKEALDIFEGTLGLDHHLTKAARRTLANVKARLR